MTTRPAGQSPTALLGHYHPLRALPSNTRPDFGKGDIIPAVETAPPGARPPLRTGRGRPPPSPQDPAPAPSYPPARTPARTARTGGDRVGIEVTLIRPLTHRPGATRPARPDHRPGHRPARPDLLSGAPTSDPRAGDGGGPDDTTRSWPADLPACPRGPAPVPTRRALYYCKPASLKILQYLLSQYHRSPAPL